MGGKQVDSSHYGFRGYVTEGRWSSLWHQLDEVARLGARRVLEIGPGPGLFRAIAARFGVAVETLDVDPELRPDHVASATAIPLADGSYDLVCAFQVLEHLPYPDALRAFAEMARVSAGHVVISLPDARPAWRYVAHIPGLGTADRVVERPRLRAPAHRFDGEHHWEINARGFALERVLRDLGARAELLRTYRVRAHLYHRFLVFAKRGTPAAGPR